MICDRCHRDTRASSVSWFNRETICVDCSLDEEWCPNYGRARRVEAAATLGGDYNFRGIGLAPEDRVVLFSRLAARNATPVRGDSTIH